MKTIKRLLRQNSEQVKSKLSKGSVLVFTLLVLFMLLISALGIASVTIIERKTSGTTGKSTQSFQIADSGAEVVLQKIYKDSYRTVDDLVTAGGMSCNVISGKATIGGSIALGKDYAITFEDDSSNDIASCTDSTTEIRRIKSVGSYASTSRAVEVAVAQCEGFGEWESKDPDTVYPASTDGFVVAWAKRGFSGIISVVEIIGYTDENNPPTTAMAWERTAVDQLTGGFYVTITMPVKAGDYWKIEENSSQYSIYWLPLGCN